MAYTYSVFVQLIDFVQLICKFNVEIVQLICYSLIRGDHFGTIGNAGSDPMAEKPQEKAINGLGSASGWKDVSVKRPVCGNILSESVCLH
jgi:hypothetical protein